ncbi:MAG: hypothetical protein DI534_14955 [Leifsonia xyli]|nr:MAG: hypothetical protein DI534_14955 [Leifsonia xyli]
MAKLTLRWPYEIGEAFTSFVSRLAARNLVPTVRIFCADLGLPFQAVAAGRSDVIEAVADLTGEPSEALREWALFRDDQDYALKGQKLIKASLRREKLQVCPHCLAEDQARLGHPFQRAIWTVTHIRTCPAHSVSLAPVSVENPGVLCHDFALIMRRPDTVIGHDLSVERTYSNFETYLSDRLSGKATSGWLDTLEFHVAAKFCEMLGAVALFGRTPMLNQLTEADWYSAGERGFQIASAGKSAVRELLSDLQRGAEKNRRANEGGQACFGRLYQWALGSAVHPSYDAIRDLIAEHLIETTALGPGDTLFGKPVERRRLHSVRTAHLLTGVHPKPLRRALLESGLLDPGLAHESDSLALFAAEPAEAFLSDLIGSLSTFQAEEYLNASRTQVQLLLTSGVVPAISVNDELFRQHTFSRRALDKFLADLTNGAEMVEVPTPEMATISAASKRAKVRSSMDIVRMILKKEIWWGQVAGSRGYAGIVVNVDEIKRNTRATQVDGLPEHKVIKELKSSYHVVKALISKGVLSTITVKNPENLCPLKIVPNADLKRFRETYVALFELSAIRQVHPRTLSKQLAAEGVKPALSKNEFKATFYLRKDVAA